MHLKYVVIITSYLSYFNYFSYLIISYKRISLKKFHVVVSREYSRVTDRGANSKLPITKYRKGRSANTRVRVIIIMMIG